MISFESEKISRPFRHYLKKEEDGEVLACESLPEEFMFAGSFNETLNVSLVGDYVSERLGFESNKYIFSAKDGALFSLENDKLPDPNEASINKEKIVRKSLPGGKTANSLFWMQSPGVLITYSKEYQIELSFLENKDLGSLKINLKMLESRYSLQIANVNWVGLLGKNLIIATELHELLFFVLEENLQSLKGSSI